MPLVGFWSLGDNAAAAANRLSDNRLRYRVKLGITPKLFMVLLAANVVIAIEVGVAVQMSVNMRFRSYLEEREDRRLGALSSVLANAYAERGDWQFLRGNDSLWDAFNRPAFPSREAGSPRDHGPPSDRGQGLLEHPHARRRSGTRARSLQSLGQSDAGATAGISGIDLTTSHLQMLAS